jgi:non-specific serine/threonine protein kinase
LVRLESELPNLRAALGWLHGVGEAELSLHLSGALNGFWYFRGHFSEGRTWLTRALARRPANVSPAVLARALQIAGELAHYQGDDGEAIPLLEESLPFCREAGDDWGAAFGRYLLGLVAEDSADYAGAASHIEEALAFWGAGRYARWEAIARYSLGVVALSRGDLLKAAEFGEQARIAFHDEGDTWGVASTLSLLGMTAVERGDHVGAAVYYMDALPRWRELGLPEGLLRVLAGIATLAANTGRLHESARLFGAVNAIAETIGFSLDLHQQAVFDRAAASVREQLGESGFTETWGMGRILSREDAITAALDFVTALSTPKLTLTPREMDVMLLLATDLTVATIAEALFLSIRTVENHTARIFTKLAVRSRAEAVSVARAAGLIENDSGPR